MPTIVTIKSTAAIAVISERIVDDGRERHHNGVDHIAPGKERSFIVDSEQSLRVVELVEEAAPAPAEAATDQGAEA